jgi:hypothetical protein
MTRAEIEKHCDELRKIVDLGPGTNAIALNQASEVLSAFQGSAAKWHAVKEALVDVEDGFSTWFSPARWRGKEGGTLARELLVGDIERLRSALLSSLYAKS